MLQGIETKGNRRREKKKGDRRPTLSPVILILLQLTTSQPRKTDKGKEKVDNYKERKGKEKEDSYKERITKTEAAINSTGNPESVVTCFTESHYWNKRNWKRVKEQNKKKNRNK